jgi:hypothetical protein
MKVIAINPGRVYPPVQVQDVWTYSIEYVFNTRHRQMVSSSASYTSANEAKQKMREEVYRLRIKHGLIERAQS